MLTAKRGGGVAEHERWGRGGASVIKSDMRKIKPSQVARGIPCETLGQNAQRPMTLPGYQSLYKDSEIANGFTNFFSTL